MRFPTGAGLLASAAILLLAVPASAARRPQPLVDLPPINTGFVDRVGHVPRASSRALNLQRNYATADGLSVAVRFSSSYTPDDAVAQSYVDFLDGLPHGSELGALKLYIAPLTEVVADCGGVDGTLACYDPQAQTMTVPGEQPDPEQAGGFTVSYVLAHEYGHHVARHRLNPPYSALDYGPKYWASQEMVCLGALQGRLAPGDEGDNYLANPGEGWADTYAHLKYPDVAWQFTSLLEPDAAAFAAARRDVLRPWTKGRTKVLRGRFTPSGPDALDFAFTLRLDGTVKVALRGPAGTNYDLALSSRGKSDGGTSAAGSRDVYRVAGGCREAPAELIHVRVLRRSGSGPFTATVGYPG